MDNKLIGYFQIKGKVKREEIWLILAILCFLKKIIIKKINYMFLESPNIKNRKKNKEII